MEAAQAGALHELKVIDLSRVLAGPYCTQILADHGADVVKVEPPEGDETRTLGPPFDEYGVAAYCAGLNRNKRAMALNLSSAAGREVLLRLLREADVVVENFLPGTMRKWGLDYEQDLAPRFPRLVYCSITGFGASGPLRGKPGYDAVVQALCGVMSVNGFPENGPTRIGIPIVDIATGMHAVIAILLALAERARSGRGQRAEATLFDSAFALLHPHSANWLLSGRDAKLTGNAHPNISPYGTYDAADGQVFLGIVNNSQFRKFCSVLGREDIANDPRFATNTTRLENRPALQAAINDMLRPEPVGPLCERLMDVGVPASAVRSVAQAMADAHAAHRGTIVSRGGYRGVRPAQTLSRSSATVRRPPPSFAADTRSVLQDAGYSTSEIEQLVTSGVTPLTQVTKLKKESS